MAQRGFTPYLPRDMICAFAFCCIISHFDVVNTFSAEQHPGRFAASERGWGNVYVVWVARPNEFWFCVAETAGRK